jgi:3-hydroxyacyl-[acyl-carrier-protein] dehydratase
MLTPDEVLKLLPHQPPFRFVDRILESDEHHVVAEYTFRPDEFFYRGHFPGNPLTPAVILLETMAQAATAIPIQLFSLEVPVEELASFSAVLSDASFEVEVSVPPGATVRTRAEQIFWRRGKIKMRMDLSLADGTLAAHGTVGGMVRRRA